MPDVHTGGRVHQGQTAHVGAGRRAGGGGAAAVRAWRVLLEVNTPERISSRLIRIRVATGRQGALFVCRAVGLRPAL